MLPPADSHCHVCDVYQRKRGSPALVNSGGPPLRAMLWAQLRLRRICAIFSGTAIACQWPAAPCDICLSSILLRETSPLTPDRQVRPVTGITHRRSEDVCVREVCVSGFAFGFAFLIYQFSLVNLSPVGEEQFPIAGRSRSWHLDTKGAYFTYQTKEHTMKKRITKNTRERQITRRELIGGALAAAGVITGAPAFLRGQNLNNKLNIAMIACGGRANANMNGDGDSRRRERDARAAAPSGPPTGIPAENITVLCDVNQDAVDAAAQRFPKAKKYNDLRRVFDSPNDFDAVMVSTAEHTHALATYLALTHGKHVYCEKPLTHDVWEARLIRETAAKYPQLATQTGNQGHASPVRRQIKELLMAGAIGPVREVHVWAGRAWGLQSAASAEKYDKPHGFYNGIQITERFKEEMPVPPNIHWDLWIGPAPMRPFHATYLPGPRWYRWWDFGNGTMSDLGGHDNDVVFQVLDIRQPLTVEAVSPDGQGPPGTGAGNDDRDV